MIYLTQLIYIHEGQEAVFEEFEDVAMPLIEKYNGRLLLRVRPDAGQVIDGGLEKPYEIHLVSFESEADFQRFGADEERRKFLHLKEQSVRSTLLVRGSAL